MPRTLPSAQETVRILANRRTRAPPGPPPAAGRALIKTIKALEGRFGQGADALKARWREIVGDELARRTEPSRFVKSRQQDGSTLELRVEGPSAAIIQHRGPEILERVNLFLGAGAVARLRIVQGPLRGRAQQRAGRTPTALRRRAKGPLDAAAEQSLAAELAGFAEGPLKAALTRLGREVMRDAAKDA